MRAGSAGLTVVEMLVAMTIVAMTMALGMQALMQWNRAQERFSEAEHRGRELLLGEEWIRDALRSRLARADTLDDGSRVDAMQGSASRLSFATLAPVGGRRGVPARQSWRLVETTEGPRLDIEGGPSLRLPDDGVPRFVYVDEEGEVHDRWPPQRIAADEFPRLVGIAFGRRLWIEAQPLKPVTVPHEDALE